MNREIKFRGLDAETGELIDDFLYLIDLNVGYAYYRDSVGNPQRCKVSSLMQYTGLKDKNGRDIFEGDVVRILYTDWVSKSEGDPRTLEQYKIDKSHIGVVTYSVDRFLLNFGEENEGRITEGTHGEKEVIGNIYENPELLNY